MVRTVMDRIGPDPNILHGNGIDGQKTQQLY